jgi:cytochrome c553
MGITMQEAAGSITQARRNLLAENSRLHELGPQIAQLVQEAYALAQLDEMQKGKQRSAVIMKLNGEAVSAIGEAHRALGAMYLIAKETSDMVSDAEAQRKHAAVTYRV